MPMKRKVENAGTGYRGASDRRTERRRLQYNQMGRPGPVPADIAAVQPRKPRKRKHRPAIEMGNG